MTTVAFVLVFPKTVKVTTIYKEQVFVFCWLRVVGLTKGLGRDALCRTFCSLMKS